MPGRKAKPPRLWLRTEADGQRAWVILDRGRQVRTGCSEADAEGAEAALGAYLSGKRSTNTSERDPARIKLGDVIVSYAASKAPEGRPRTSEQNELLTRLGTLNEFWGALSLADVRKQSSRDYVTWRTSQETRNSVHARSRAMAAGRPLPKPRLVASATARRELEDLRSAIRDVHGDTPLLALPKIEMPERSPSRQRWLTRNEAARLLGAALGFVWDAKRGAWKREKGKLVRRDRVTRTRRRHIARFILIGLYSGRREAAIRGTQWMANTTSGWFDLDRWIYHGRGSEERATKKRRPPAKIAYRLRPHLGRWYRMDMGLLARLREEDEDATVLHVVHRPDGRPLADKIKTGWAGVLSDAGLGSDVNRHALRHTAATWLMQKATDFWEAAGFLAMTLETLENTYGHHHPDFQEGAAAAFGGRKV